MIFEHRARHEHSVDSPRPSPELALSMLSIRSSALSRGSLQHTVNSVLGGAAHAPAAAHLLERPVTRLYFGSEFCERLQPSPRQLERAIAAVRRQGLELTLATTILSDRTLGKLRVLLSLLEPTHEVVANDWGTLRLMASEFPQLVPIAGRLLCKMLKDPRLPSPQWSALQPTGIHSSGFRAVLEHLHVKRIEMDVAPFATAAGFQSPAFAISAHVPFGFSAKGRRCWFGSLHEPAAAQFNVVPACRRECLQYRAELSRPDSRTPDLATIQRGNTLFYRHSPAMENTVADAIRAGAINRIIVAGDWH